MENKKWEDIISVPYYIDSNIVMDITLNCSMCGCQSHIQLKPKTLIEDLNNFLNDKDRNIDLKSLGKKFQSIYNYIYIIDDECGIDVREYECVDKYRKNYKPVHNLLLCIDCFDKWTKMKILIEQIKRFVFVNMPRYNENNYMEQLYNFLKDNLPDAIKVLCYHCDNFDFDNKTCCNERVAYNKKYITYNFDENINCPFFQEKQE